MEEATESNTKPERKGEGAASAALPHVHGVTIILDGKKVSVMI